MPRKLYLAFFASVFSFFLPELSYSQCELVINDPPTVCEGLTVDLTLPAVTDGSGENLALTYWKDTTAETALDNPLAVDSAGVYFIKALGTGDCEIILPVKVTIVERPNLVITDPPPVCAPASVDLTSTWITRGSDPGLVFSYYIDASGTRPLTFADNIKFSGTYYIKAEAEGGCLSFKPVVVTIIQGINLVINDPVRACVGDSADLTRLEVTEGSDPNLTFSYWIDPSCTEPLPNPLKVTEAGIYYIMAGNEYACFHVMPLEVEFVEPYQDLEIAVLSVETVTGKNNLYWDPPLDMGVEFINVYKKNYQSGELELLETISDYSSGIFTDDMSDPSGSFESYAISVVDTCGNESDTSSIHKSINLVGALSGNAVNLLWNEYVGREISFYKINRRSDGGEWENVGTVLGNTHLYSDENPGDFPQTYIIEAIPRDPDLSLGMNIFSNELRVESSGIETIDVSQNIKVYPNPFHSTINIELDWEEGKKGIIEMYNLLGEICHQWEFNSSQVVLDTGEVPEGVYFLRIRGDKEFKKLLIKTY